MAALNLLNHGFGHCSEEALASFTTDLNQGPWVSVPAANDNSPDRRPASSLLRESFPTVWRSQLTWVCEDMAAALHVTLRALLDRHAPDDGIERGHRERSRPHRPPRPRHPPRPRRPSTRLRPPC